MSKVTGLYNVQVYSLSWWEKEDEYLKYSVEVLYKMQRQGQAVGF